MGGFGRNRMEGVVYHDAYALLALTKAEGAAKLYLILQLVLRDQLLQLLHYLTGSFDVAGASNTNCNFHKSFLAFIFIYMNKTSSTDF